MDNIGAHNIAVGLEHISGSIDKSNKLQTCKLLLEYGDKLDRQKVLDYLRGNTKSYL